VLVAPRRHRLAYRPLARPHRAQADARRPASPQRALTLGLQVGHTAAHPVEAEGHTCHKRHGGARGWPWECRRAGPGAAGGQHGSRRDAGAPAGVHQVPRGWAQRPAEAGQVR